MFINDKYVFVCVCIYLFAGHKENKCNFTTERCGSHNLNPVTKITINSGKT